jgi:hypothetical protein
MATARIHQSLIATIVAANFMANEQQVAQLAHTVVEGLDADGTYLRVVLAHMKSQLGNPRRGKQPPQEPVLDKVHEALYPSVLKGVGPDDMPQEERNRRANFARSAASTVRYFIRNGGDVRGVDVPTASKSGLRRAVQPEQGEAAEGETRTQRGFRTHAQALLAAAVRLARGDPEDARERVESLMDELDKLLTELGTEPTASQPQQDMGATTTIVGPRLGGRSTGTQPAQLHRGA